MSKSGIPENHFFEIESKYLLSVCSARWPVGWLGKPPKLQPCKQTETKQPKSMLKSSCQRIWRFRHGFGFRDTSSALLAMVSPFLSSVGVEGGERLESVRGRREAGRREWKQKPPSPPLAETSPSDLRISQ